MKSNFPPRGSGVPGRRETLPMAAWVSPDRLGPTWDWAPGKILLGRDGDRRLGLSDDRHVVTFAGTGAGKTSTVLKHNAALWSGSLVVLDPKGELAMATAQARLALGQEIHVMDPFGVTKFASASYNPFDELGFGREDHVPADAALAAEAIITQHGGGDQHWSDAARNFIRGVILHERDKGGVDLRRLRQLANTTPARLEALLSAMVDSDAHDGTVSNAGSAFLGKLKGSEREFTSILSTLQEQTASLDDLVGISAKSDFRLSDLREGNLTIYLVLPGMRMMTHFRWLRLIVQMALAALERQPVPRGGVPVLFMLEEFAALGPMRSIESAAGLMRGYGVKLWAVLQDLTQLKTHYPKSYESFIGNCGQLQSFGLTDLTTTEHLSKLLGNTQVVDQQDVRVSASAMGNGDSGRREHPRSR